MNSDPKHKMFEMISEMAAPFISGGKTSAEKHHRLTAACSAWNMACGSAEARHEADARLFQEDAGEGNDANRKLGSGLIIYEYDLDDGTKMRLGFPGFAPIQYAHHVQKDGKFVVIPVK